MQTFGACLKIRRGVGVAHAQLPQIGNNLSRLGESELTVELQPVSTNRNPRMNVFCHSGRSRRISHCLSVLEHICAKIKPAMFSRAPRRLLVSLYIGRKISVRN